MALGPAAGRFPPEPGRPPAPRLPAREGYLSEQTCLGHAYACTACFCALLGPVAFKVLRVIEFIPLTPGSGEGQTQLAGYFKEVGKALGRAQDQNAFIS